MPALVATGARVHIPSSLPHTFQGVLIRRAPLWNSSGGSYAGGLIGLRGFTMDTMVEPPELS